MANSNPFGSSSAGPYSRPSISANRAGSKTPFSSVNPFSQSSSAPSASGNPFAAAPNNSPFGAPNGPAAVPSSKPPETTPARNPFGSPFGQPSTSDAPFPKTQTSGFGASSAPSTVQNILNSQKGFEPQGVVANGTSNAHSSGHDFANGQQGHIKPTSFGQVTKQSTTSPSRRETPTRSSMITTASDYAKAIFDQLEQDGVRAPEWPKDPGSQFQRSEMEIFVQKHKKYRDRARSSLIKANLIDDPEKQKSLSDAIDFKGICEEMCPEWEKMKRIIQHDVKHFEKGSGDVPEPDLMVKALARSAAGQEAPLPMDVLSISACKRVVDYLLEDVLSGDNNLPVAHGFLWDRTRAVRRDFVFHSRTTDEEKLDQIYCLEKIVRFHVLSLHLMSQNGFPLADYSEKQEIEQLSKSLLSLQDIYKRCRKDGRVKPPNEAEFVAYSILLYARDPSALSRVYQWGKKMYDESKEVRTAIAIVEAIQNTWDLQGPEIGSAGDSLTPYTTALPGYSMLFSILEDPEVSYTMACFGEIHFGWVRQSMLKTIHAAYWRPKTALREWTIQELKQLFRFDCEEEAVEFLQQHGVETNTNDNGERIMMLVQKGNIELRNIKQAFSKNIVEQKRGDASLQTILSRQVYQQSRSQAAADESSDDDSLFVSDNRSSVNNIASIPSPQPPVGAQAPCPAPAATAPTTQQSTPSPFSQNQPAQPNGSSLLSPKSTSSPLRHLCTQPPNSSDSEPSRVLNKPVPFPNFQPPKGRINLQATTTALPSPPVSAVTTAPSISKPLFAKSASVARYPSAAPVAPGSVTGSVVGAGFQVAPSTPISTGTKEEEESSQPFSFPAAASHSPSTAKAGAHLEIESKQTFPVPAQQLSQAAVVKSSSSTGDTSCGSKRKESQTPASVATSAQKPQALTPSSRSPSDKTCSIATKQASPGPSDSAVDIFIPMGEKVAAQDPFKGLTSWVVMGDGGLMDQFLEVEVERLLAETFSQFETEQEEARQREDERRNARVAQEFRERKLAVEYGHIWYRITQRSASRRRRRDGRAKVQAWREEKIASNREARLAEERKRRQKERESLDRPDKLAELRKAVDSQRRCRDQRAIEMALLGTGLLSGVRDMEASVKRVASDGGWDDEEAFENGVKRRKLDGSITGGSFSKSLSQLQARTPSIAPADDTASVASGISSILSQSVRSRGKTGKILDELRRKDGLGRNFRLSIPPAAPLTRSISSSAPSQHEKERQRHSAVPHPYWVCKLHGHVIMPNGQMLPEKIAHDIQHGKRYPKLYAHHGDSFSPPSASTKRQHSYLVDVGDAPTMPFKKHRAAASSDASADNTAQLAGEDDGRAARLERLKISDPETYRLIMSTRKTSKLLEDATELLRDINRTRMGEIFLSEAPEDNGGT